jgi:recombinational DNA repair protein (RecF pathway)
MKEPLNPVLPPKKEEEKLKCCECGKPIDFYYGRYAEGGVCSRTCDILHMQKRKGE